jgi:glycosyltransferase involved in cell wall biosynthesis
MDAPLVSIIIPTYDRPKLLFLTLESIKAQTFSDYEVVVVDDGTPNEESKMVCDQYPNVKYIKIENSGGPAKPRNIGISRAKGHYIALIDDDDLWLPLKLAKQVEILEKNPDYGLVHSPCRVMDKDGNISEVIIGKPGSPSVKHGNVTMSMIGNWTLMTSTVMVRREVIEKVGLFNEEMPPAGEDVEFWVRCSFYTSFFYQDEPLVHYRQHESTSKLYNKKYIYLPKYLNQVIKRAHKEGLITTLQFNSISKNLVWMQIKNMKYGLFRTLSLLFQLNPLWFLNFGNIKLLIRKVISP